ncbi:MAG: Tex family protein [Pontibacterium sp.]
MHIEQQLATELQVRPQQVRATIGLLDEGATVPFIARYRKEITGALDDNQLRQLAQRLVYLRELNERRNSIINSIEEQGKLSEALKKQLLAADNKSSLEDLYLPFRPKRRTKAQKAREAGLEPLADLLLQDGPQTPGTLAQPFINPTLAINNSEQALEGAQHILIEQFAEQASLVGKLREWLWKRGQLRSRLVKGKDQEGSKFRDYFDYSEAIQKIPSHRALALLRGVKAGILRLSLQPDESELSYPLLQISRENHLRIDKSSRGLWLENSVQRCWKQKLQPQLETDLIKRLREHSENEAIRVFGLNLSDLLLAAPAGPKTTIGLDPGLRTGVKVAVVDATGKVLDHCAIYPHVPRKQWDQSLAVLSKLASRYQAQLISIGNGTASRETEQLARELIEKHPALKLTAVMVSEAGASVYSASELAAKEFPNLDVSIRGAVSIARRLQDPLAELVKIEPKAIGVGQYQHDLDQARLGQKLEAVVEDCVNHVGVDLNTASAELLNQVAGLTQSTAHNIVAFRETQGRFSNRNQLKKVPRLGPKAFQQCAGFLRIREGDNPLDNSAVHPETYALVKQIANTLQCTVSDLLNAADRTGSLNPQQFISDQYGRYTVQDVLQELEKPGRDPRPEFRTAQFSQGVESLNDLTPGMTLEGAVTNVTNFGAFVDIGVHQDGLVHISQLADRFIKDPHELVKTGDIVQVSVLEVDMQRKRIALSMKGNHSGSKESKNTGRSHTIAQGQLADKLKSAGFNLS